MHARHTPSILFVCMGNICRSPTGEGVFRAHAEAAGQAHVRIDSAGTTSHHVGERADPRMRAAAARRGYDLTSRSRRVVAADFEAFDLIIAMDRDNLRDLLELQQRGGGAAEVRLLSAFLPDGIPEDVPDPYYGGAAGFETVLDLIETACPALLRRLVAQGPD